MRILKPKSLLSLMLILSPLTASALGIQVGPFSLQLGENVQANRQTIVDTPVCHAIRHHKQIEVVLEMNQKVNEQEFSSVIKKVTVEPYLLGIDKEGRAVLKGNIVKELVLKEVMVKYPQIKQGNEGVVSGYFNFSGEGGVKDTIHIDQIRDVLVLPDSNVKVPDNLQELAKDIQVLCIL